MKLNDKVQKVVDMVKADKGLLKTNCQRALITLLLSKQSNGWTKKEAVLVPNASRRIRELRESKYGFKVDCKKENGQTFYRIDPQSVTKTRVASVLLGGGC